jgi:DmsE family decaheme c-type cytochrome
VCLRCHDRTMKVAGFRNSRHGRKGASCTTCHAVHQKTRGEANLVKDEVSLCVSCHSEKQAEIHMPNRHPVVEGKVVCSDCHNPHTNSKTMAKNYSKSCVKCHPDKAGPFASEHQAVAESCLNCHSPHGGVNEKLLNAAKPGLCLSCHAGERFTIVQGPHNLANGANNDCTAAGCHAQIHGSNDPNNVSLQ